MECARDDLSILYGERINLQRTKAADVPELARIMQDPNIIQWWGVQDAQSIREQLVDQDMVMVYTIRPGKPEDKGPIIGSVQAFEEPSPEFRHAGMDVFIDAQYRQQGYATDTISTMAKVLFHDHGHHRIVVQPSAHNTAAIAAWKKVGFKEAGYLRQYQRAEDGTWMDAVLLELLISDTNI